MPPGQEKTQKDIEDLWASLIRRGIVKNDEASREKWVSDFMAQDQQQELVHDGQTAFRAGGGGAAPAQLPDRLVEQQRWESRGNAQDGSGVGPAGTAAEPRGQQERREGAAEASGSGENGDSDKESESDAEEKEEEETDASVRREKVMKWN